MFDDKALAAFVSAIAQQAKEEQFDFNTSTPLDSTLKFITFLRSTYPSTLSIAQREMQRLDSKSKQGQMTPEDFKVFESLTKLLNDKIEKRSHQGFKELTIEQLLKLIEN
tara:strand:+ start:614 stop:943 length:330 start_codon:yes stop_codon:yes gene_type:complete